MTGIIHETERLILRRWRASDRAPYAALMADPEVGAWLGATLTQAQSEAQIAAADALFSVTGWGLLAVERKTDRAFIGAAGARPVDEYLPVDGSIEIGWRFARTAWGGGYATEAARVILAEGLARPGLEEIIALTSRPNLRSQAVMTRLSMIRDPSRDFDHPGLALDDPLRPHVVYVARAITPGGAPSP